MEQFQRSFERYIFGQHEFYFFYPLILQEFIYVLNHARGLTRSILFKKNVGDENHLFSLLIVKRLLTRIYPPNHCISATYSNLNPYFEHKKNISFQMIPAEVFTEILEISFSLFFLLASIENKKIKESKNLRSIHSIFTFLEEKFSHLNYISNILIPYPVHLKILVQIIRYWVKDASSLHFLQSFFFHENCNCNWNHLIYHRSISLSKNQRLFLFLYNSHVCEHESIFVFIRNQSSHLRSIFFVTLLDRIYFYGKIEHHIVGLFTSYFQTILWLFKDPFMHYVRYQGKSLLASKGIPFMMRKWKYYFVHFWQCRFYVWSQPRIHRNISNHSLDFLGYLSTVRRNPSLVRSQMLENAYIIDNSITKKFDTTVPILPLMGSLANKKFCNVLGHSISKSVWSDLADSDIFYLFWCIRRNISHYHSGSSKKNSILRIQYILQLSCVRTLARKHKSTVRAFLNQFGSELLEDVFMEEKQVLSFILSRSSYTSRRCLYNSRIGHIWYLDILCINALVHHSSTDSLLSNHVTEKNLLM
uniref:Maturase K n=3 Tax=Phoradendron leucarpum TaxID=3970 RepID=D3WCK1_PHOLC|nr:maturase K protein [Phoradendron leucarpum]